MTTNEETFCEIGMFATNSGTAFGMDKIQVPADGVITGLGVGIFHSTFGL